MPNVLATIAVFASLAGTAYAAITITGRNVRDSTLLSRDFKNLSLTTMDFTTATRTQLRVKGPTGDTGPQGPQGNVGAKGATGDKGQPAPKAFTFQTSAQSSRVGGNNPNPAATDTLPTCQASIDAGDPMIGCTTGADSPIRYPRWNYWCGFPSKHCKTTTLSVPQLSRSNRTVLVTSENASGGLLDMPYAGTIVLNASATFYTQRSGANQRLECQLQIAKVENGVQLPAEDVGVPATVYRYIDPTNLNQQERLLNIAVTAAVAKPVGVYETQLVCRGPDDNGLQADRLEFIEGNMSVLSTRTNGQA